MTTEMIHEQMLKEAAIAKTGVNMVKTQAAGNLSNTVYGQLVNNGPVINELAGKLESFIKDYIVGLKGNAKASYGPAFDYLTTPDFSHTKKDDTKVYFTFYEKCQKLIVIGLSAALDCVYSDKDNASLLSHVSVVIGQAIEQEAVFNSFKLQNEWLFNATWEANMSDPLFGAAYAAQQMTQFLESKGLVPGESWSVTSDLIHAKVGSLVMQTIIDGMENPLFSIETVVANNKTETHVIATEFLLDDVDKLAELINNKAFTKLPMVEKPVDWSDDQPGGYVLNGQGLNLPLIRQKTGFEVGTAGEHAINMLNNLQGVALTINHQVVELAQKCLDKGIALGSLTAVGKDANAAAKKIAQRKNSSNIAALNAASQMMDHAEWFLPWSFDSRGRVYPQASVLGPQTNDFGKSLIMFAEPGPFDVSALKWLAIHLANCYGNGIDKLPLADRVGWVKAAGKAIIKQVATNPMATIKSWTQPGAKCPDEPWQFIAAAMEWYACVITGKQTTTSIMVATDATCSGLQMLSGLMLDEQAAAHVNVIAKADGTIGDAYTACAQLAAAEFIDVVAAEYDLKVGANKLKELLTGPKGRKIAKKVVMTTPYNSGQHTQTGEIAELFAELGIKLDKKGKQALVLAKSLREALRKLMPNVIVGMESISQSVFDYVKANKLSTISWTSPSGFKVVQSKFQVKSSRIQLLGSTKRIVIETVDWDKGNAAKHKSATAPNLIHSIDASMLHLTFNDADFPFSLIHDSVLTRACDMEKTVGMLKQTFVDVFSTDVLGKFADEVGLSMPSIKGDLDVTAVLDSEYYFS